MATPPPLLQPPEAPARPYLEVRLEGASPSRRPLQVPKAVVGRGAGCEVLLNHPSVSRRHAELERTGDGRWLVRDLRSRNGTRVNGEVVSEQALRPGDLVQIGQFTLRLFAEETPSRMSRGPATDDTPTYSITLFRNFEPPRISAAQISTILEFGRGLLSEANGTERLRRLLRLAIGRELGGLWAYALRVSKDPEALDPFNMCDPEQAAVPPGAAERDPHVSKSVLRSVLANNEAVVANNVAHFSHHQADVSIAADTAAFSAVACPLASHPGGNGSHGAMDILYVILPPRLGSVEWMTLLSLAVEQYRQADATWTARAAAEAKVVVDKEMAMAREVQARTLPRRRGVESGVLEWALRFEPSLVVCGDYVDVIARDDGTVLLAIADVAGKGMQAALVAASLHATFHTTARMGLPLSGMVAAVNQHFREFLPDASFVTAAALLLDPRTGEGQCVNCGHLPVLAVSPDGTVREMEGGDNTPLGVLEDAVQSSGFRLDVGEWVILYTDGLTEMANTAGQMLGMKPLAEQLGRLCAENRDCSAEELAQRLTDWLDAYRGAAAPGDDRTFLIARRVG
ncbi:MAG TPA: SpoIIE family protein phosphatase [Tepidisphaeraceae bacterium]|nr:SpoIIE family protein phosphatase [Tepidisphaeraceae bacterium]